MSDAALTAGTLVSGRVVFLTLGSTGGGRMQIGAAFLQSCRRPLPVPVYGIEQQWPESPRAIQRCPAASGGENGGCVGVCCLSTRLCDLFLAHLWRARTRRGATDIQTHDPHLKDLRPAEIRARYQMKKDHPAQAITPTLSRQSTKQKF